MFDGRQDGGTRDKDVPLFAVAVRRGDVIDGPSVPEPHILGLMMDALGTLTVFRRRRTLAH